MKFAVWCALAGIVVLGSLLAVAGCSNDQERVVVYCALDRNFAEPILKIFENQTGIEVDWQFDTEAHKTVGLARRIEEEANNPRCDVFWNNEIMHTIRLKKLGLIEPYVSVEAESLPAKFKDPDGYWHGFAARARIFIVNTDLMEDPESWPRSYADLVDARFEGLGTMAKPLTGTTQTHVAALFSVLGDDATWGFVDGLFDNDVMLTSGNASVMRQVRMGERAFGFTDTDDFNVAWKDKYPVGAVYPDSGEGELGTLLIPNTVSIVKGAPHREQAERLVDFLLSDLVEKMLAYDSAQIPVREHIERPPNVVHLSDIHTMNVDFEQVADAFVEREQALVEKFQ